LLFENLIAREAAKIVQEYDYGPFGNTIDAQGYSENGYRFTGKETDFETGLIYFGARYYDPEVGRFITKDLVDPLLSNPQDLNRYIYCLNNPLKYVDPFGLSWWNPFSWDWGGIWDAFTDFFTDIIPSFFESFGNWLTGEGWYTNAELRDINRLASGFSGRLLGLTIPTNVQQTTSPLRRMPFIPGRYDYLHFENNALIWRSGWGRPLANWAAVSGPGGRGRLPDGLYMGDNLRIRPRTKGMIREGVGWSLDLNPQFQTDRTYLRIHPDDILRPGTRGCIGVQAPAYGLWELYYLLDFHLGHYGPIPVYVGGIPLP